jgi:hypothetical protein
VIANRCATSKAAWRVATVCLEFVVSGVGFVWMRKAADPVGFVLAAAVNQIGCGMLLPTLLT